MFTHIKIPWLNDSVKITDVTNPDGARFYTIVETNLILELVFPSITTILKSYNEDIITAWKERVGLDEARRISKEALDRGNAIHKAAEKYLNNNPRNIVINGMKKIHIGLFGKLKRSLDKHITNVYCLETPLYSKKLGIAGRCDVVADWDGIPSIVDFKGSGGLKKEDWILHYKIQACFYAHAFGQMTGKKIEQCVIIVASDGTKDLEFAKKIKYNGHIKSLGNTIQIFKFPAKDFQRPLLEQVNKYYEENK